jgi:hypothetical protein
MGIPAYVNSPDGTKNQQYGGNIGERRTIVKRGLGLHVRCKTYSGDRL